MITFMEVNILFDTGFEQTVRKSWLRKIAQAVLTAENRLDAELGIVITGQDKIRELNKRYREQDRPTDVLSFAMTDASDEMVFPALEGEVRHLGEVVISVEQAALQAKRHRHSVAREIATLLVHGVLHLLGYDHGTPDEEKNMQDRARAVLKHLPRRAI